ncbi:spore cortex biosynthesis protein YabQ [Bacillus massilinigeriensis]|uniref:spore cortex biosynthesis protein YabQ n=1 Tax=Bacillus massilionigeriensis TaxID=1805475 RepID=UPI00096B5A55|nr:spore cortex biosynthesis protein YabQ [Bacillus massilionigeriensis]
MTLSTQFLTMLAMIGMGCFFGAALDTYNHFLQRPKRKGWIVFFNDILFWTVQGLIIFYILFLVNKGELRFYIFLALLCGFAAYQSLLKQIYLRLLEFVISTIVTIYRFFVKMFQMLVYRPIYSLVMAIISFIILLGKGLYALVRFLLKILIYIIRMVLKPFSWILSLLWNKLPKGIKNIVEKLYNKMAGYFLKIKKIIIRK